MTIEKGVDAGSASKSRAIRLARLFNFAVLSLSLVLLRLPGYFGVATAGAAWRTALMPLWLAIAISLPGLLRRRQQISLAMPSGRQLILIAYLAVFGLGLLIPIWTSSTYNQLAAVGLIMVWLTIAVLAWVGINAWPKQVDLLFSMAGFGLVVFVTVNMALFLMGQGKLGGDLRILGFLGIAGRRVTFPLVSGANSFGSVAGAAFAWSLMYAWQATREHKILLVGSLLTALLALAGILLADSRGGLLFSLLSILLVINLTKPWMPRIALAFILPILTPLGLLLGDGLASPLGIQSIWGKLNAFGSMTSRFITWRMTFTHISDPKWIHLVGYGYKGDIISGVAQAAGQLIHPTRDVAVGPHNVVLQYILDNGYLGAILFLAVMFLTLKKLAHLAYEQPNSGALPALAVLVYLTLLGTIERVPTVYSPELFAVFLFIVIFTHFGSWSAESNSAVVDSDFHPG